MKKDNIISIFWGLLLIIIISILYFPQTRTQFVFLTESYPYLMGAVKIGILGIMGDLLGNKIVRGNWQLKGIKIGQRILVWAFIGILFTVVFPLFSYGVEGLLNSGLLYGVNSTFFAAFWKSFFMNMIFAFPMMVFHRITDNLIDKGKLFTKWPLIKTFKNINWENMFKVVGAACIWFWIPAHTITFLLPSEFRVMSAALLAIVLGFILGLAKRKSIT
ncbi:MAG: hypothetical protein ACQEQD_07690 [Bacillota bacterium]